MLGPNLINHAEKKVEKSVNSSEQVRFPGFNDCKDVHLCMQFRMDMEPGEKILVISPFTNLVDHSGTENARRKYWNDLKRRYAQDLKQILTCHPAWAKILGMTSKQVEEFKPEDVMGEEIADVPGDYRARK